MFAWAYVGIESATSISAKDSHYTRGSLAIQAADWLLAAGHDAILLSKLQWPDNVTGFPILKSSSRSYQDIARRVQQFGDLPQTHWIPRLEALSRIVPELKTAIGQKIQHFKHSQENYDQMVNQLKDMCTPHFDKQPSYPGKTRPNPHLAAACLWAYSKLDPEKQTTGETSECQSKLNGLIIG